MHDILGILELENLVSCCSPLHAFFFYLKNLLSTPLVAEMLQNGISFQTCNNVIHCNKTQLQSTQKQEKQNAEYQYILCVET